ncbi:hypothetical protein GALL_501110 [mine drainage metagenome]|uniref:Uncharacterized protein n=1 Tax=mine drainage metagenome TaxID=410659 RepID=A0A1J5PL55_9ZZZZ
MLRRISISLRAPTVVVKSPSSPPSSAVVRIWISRSLVVNWTHEPVLRIITLARIGNVWRRSTIPETACRTDKTLFWVSLITIMWFSSSYESMVFILARRYFPTHLLQPLSVCSSTCNCWLSSVVCWRSLPIFRTACSTVVWSRPPKSSPISGRLFCVSSLARYMAI